jgi:F-type H+-transporting ATPase subunit b
MKDLLQEPGFFYAVSFVIFIGLVFLYGRKPALAWLDAEIAKVRHELDQAAHLRAEAEAALDVCRTKQIEAEAAAREIVILAQQQVEEMRREAGLELTATLERHKKMAEERIHMAEAEAIAEVRGAAIDLAMTIARKNISDTLSDPVADRLADQAIAQMPGLDGKKAKAA